MGGRGSGGARVRSGPTPNRGSLRSGTDRGGWTHLRPDEHVDEIPAWPLPGRPTKFELERWSAEWQRPQALMWERLGLELQVAVYVRSLREAIRPGAAGGRMDIVRRQMDDLGLSVAGLAKNRWVIDETPAAVARPRAASSSAKDRFRTIQGGADAAAS